ncbi:hypothetical protein KFL_000380370 [Klebsormidium nitens]|uniref:Uncharacterized protein n=1 Tax=Klebsormidium nitens TaxID=105231 RepID=A0A1Y1HMF8_KLENI|nr:hypothetical protein KFL_000380370 [Klebsormidium nitens]|eukprot:GAQ79805.1 hypothetical protein KFL_000380370 [Klebsormidium nitens]
MFIRRDNKGVCFALKDMAFEYYQAAMRFNSFTREQPSLLYKDRELLWLAIHVAYKQLGNPCSEQARIVEACHLVAHVQNPAGQKPGDLEELLTEEERVAAAEAAQHQTMEEMMETIIDQGLPTLTKLRLADMLTGTQERANGQESAEESGARLCKAYEKLRELRTLRAAKKGLEDHLQPLGGLIAWMACSSLNKYETLRKLIMYEARKPFSYFNSELGENVTAEPQNCARIVLEKYSIKDECIPALFKWSERAYNDPESAEHNQGAVEAFKEGIQEYLADNLLPIPKSIEYIIDRKHARGNSFLCVYNEAREAILVKGRRTELEGCMVRIHGVINRRKKLTMAGGISVPSLATARQASADAKQLTEHTLGWHVDKLTPSYYTCEKDGQRTLQDLSLRLKKLATNVTATEIKTWFSEHAAVVPTQVYKDNGGVNRSGSEGVSWIVEFAKDASCCDDKYADIEAALMVRRSNEHLFRGQPLDMYRLLKRARGGNFTCGEQLKDKLLKDAEDRGHLRPTPAGTPYFNGVVVEATDGATVLGKSNCNSRIQIISEEAFTTGASKLDRFWDVTGGESKVWRAQICLSRDQAEQLRESWPRMEDGATHLSLAQVLALATFLEEQGLLSTFLYKDLSQAQMRSVIGQARTRCAQASACFALFREITAALEPAEDNKAMWDVLENRSIRGLGFKRAKNTKKGIEADTAEQVVALQLCPISKSRTQTLAKFAKAECYHVTGLPVDFQGAREDGDLPLEKLPEPIPPFMHTLVRVGKKVLALLQDHALVGEDGDDRSGARLEFVFRQTAEAKTEMLAKDEAKQGDRISTAMNGEHTRLILSHYKWMFGGIMSPRDMQLPGLLTMYIGQVYADQSPSRESRSLLWLLGNLIWNLIRVIDALARAKRKNDKKPVVQTNHMHIMAVEIPKFHESCDIPLPKLLEEKLEAWQKVAKEAGLKRSDRKSDVVETMYREEWMRENAMLLYGLRGRNPEVAKKELSQFVEATVPNFLVHSCLYNQNPIFRQTFSQLLHILAERDYTEDLFFVYAPHESSQSAAKVLPLRTQRACQCTCHCKCGPSTGDSSSDCCKASCNCKCSESCSCQTGPAETCRCLKEVSLVSLTGVGPGKDKWEPLQWCEGAGKVALGGPIDPESQVAHVRELLETRRVGRVVTRGEWGSLWPLRLYIHNSAACRIQAAFRRYLHRDILQKAGQQRAALSRGITLLACDPMVGDSSGGAQLAIQGEGFASFQGRPVVRIGLAKLAA